LSFKLRRELSCYKLLHPDNFVPKFDHGYAYLT
jgi:hypothetical protein